MTTLLGLAPMAGISDMPMRALCYRMGANYACTEMVSAQGWMCTKSSNEAYRQLLETDPCEYNTAVQLFGKDPVAMGEAAARACSLRRFTSIDINMGCPARKIVSSGEGSALLLNPALAIRLMESVKRNSSLPVTVKLRLAYDDTRGDALPIVQAAQDLGFQHVCVHGRTREQQYAGHADYAAIAAIKRQVAIPIIANGDVTTPEDALRILDETHCDGLLIGRGAMGNPWVFRGAAQALAGEAPTKETLDERFSLALEHIDRMVAHKGEWLGVMEMRKHVSRYVSGVRGAAAMRRALNDAETAEQMKALLRSLFELAARKEEL